MYMNSQTTSSSANDINVDTLIAAANDRQLQQLLMFAGGSLQSTLMTQPTSYLCVPACSQNTQPLLLQIGKKRSLEHELTFDTTLQIGQPFQTVSDQQPWLLAAATAVFKKNQSTQLSLYST